MAISRQNKRSTSRRSDGFPGDLIGDLPVNAFIHPAGLPIDTSQLVWNVQSGELWRRTSEAIRKYIRRTARRHGIDPDRLRLCYGKAAEFHAHLRCDGTPVTFCWNVIANAAC